MSYHLNLKMPLRARMAARKAYAAKYPHEGKTWRDSANYAARTADPYNPPVKDPRGGNHMRWVENTDRAGLRLVGYADEVNPRIRHTGWYTDEDYYDEKLRGIVFRLPARKGKQSLIYGYEDPCNEGAAYLCFDLDAEEESDAARMADGIAEIFAEEEREYRRKDQAEQRLNDIRDELETLPGQILALVHEAKMFRHDTSKPALCDAARARLRAFLQTRETLREERDELAEQLA